MAPSATPLLSALLLAWLLPLQLGASAAGDLFPLVAEKTATDFYLEKDDWTVVQIEGRDALLAVNHQLAPETILARLGGEEAEVQVRILRFLP